MALIPRCACLKKIQRGLKINSKRSKQRPYPDQIANFTPSQSSTYFRTRNFSFRKVCYWVEDIIKDYACMDDKLDYMYCL